MSMPGSCLNILKSPSGGTPSSSVSLMFSIPHTADNDVVAMFAFGVISIECWDVKFPV